MSQVGRLAAGTAAIFATCVFCGQAVASVPGSGVSSVTTPPDTAPTTENSIPVGSDDILSELQSRYITLFDKFHSAVVRVNVFAPGESADVPLQVIVSTGFFINRNGDILTVQADKLENNGKVYVDCEGIRYLADVVGIDLVTNLALLHCPATPKNPFVLDLAENQNPPPMGTLLLAISSKQGQEPGPSPGMIQGYNINIADVHLPTLFLRTNIPDDGGEGGAPVLDLQGRVAGIIIGRLQDSRSTLVLPARAALRVLADLQAKGKVSYGLLGFDIEEKASAQSGVRVVIKSVNYGGPGLAAGLQVGDVLKSIGSTSINSDLDLRQVSFFARPGQDLPLVVQRGEETIHLTLHVEERALAGTSTPATNNPPKPATTTTGTGGANASGVSLLPDQVLGIPPPVVAPNSK